MCKNSEQLVTLKDKAIFISDKLSLLLESPCQCFLCLAILYVTRRKFKASCFIHELWKDFERLVVRDKIQFMIYRRILTSLVLTNPFKPADNSCLLL